MKNQVSIASAALLAGGQGVMGFDAAAKCASLADTLSLPNTTIWSSSIVAAGTNLSLSDNDPSCTQPFQQVHVDICRVTMQTITGPTSNISLEAWLPSTPDAWGPARRFMGTGNGGLNGCIKYEDLSYGATHGFAAIGSNNGHNGTSGRPFYHNQGVLEDFAYRAVHTEVGLGKQIAATYYGEPHKKAYYLGCSTGGRQGFKEAQDFPDDFDGIVAGAPAFNFNALQYWSGMYYIKNGEPGDAKFVSSAQWDRVYADIMTQCDGLDGVRDSVIEDTDLCQYRPEGLICAQGQTPEADACLTGRQAQTVREVYSQGTYGNGGKYIYPRLEPGGNSTAIFFTGTPFQYALDWDRYVIHDDLSWDPKTLGPDDYDLVEKQDPYGISTWEADLSAARDSGLKILHWHGTADSLISSDNSARYYNRVARAMGLSGGQLDDFYRYFRVSGTDHCGGGKGAGMIGAGESTYMGWDPEVNVLAAMVRWVEEGEAPETITGGKVQGGKVTEKRRHCRYPRRNVYNGVGDPKKADSWECK